LHAPSEQCFWVLDAVMDSYDEAELIHDFFAFVMPLHHQFDVCAPACAVTCTQRRMSVCGAQRAFYLLALYFLRPISTQMLSVLYSCSLIVT